MLAEERRIRILQMLEEKNAVQLGELATLFRVSTETVRRDLLTLEKQGRLQRTHGGAISMSRMATGGNIWAPSGARWSCW